MHGVALSQVGLAIIHGSVLQLRESCHALHGSPHIVRHRIGANNFVQVKVKAIDGLATL
ncbi:MAG: hypothetical protein ABI612_13670 [Betaproteobacteria bacterium]